MRHKLQFSRLRFRLAFFPLVLWVGLTSCWALTHGSMRAAGITLVVQSLLLMFYINAAPVHLDGLSNRVTRWLLNSLLALFLLLQVITLEYYLVQGGPLDPFLVLDSYNEVVPTFLNTFSLMVLLVGSALTLLVCAACSYGMIRLKRGLGMKTGHRGVVSWALPLTLLGVIAYSMPGLLVQSGLPLIRSSRVADNINAGLPPELKGKMKDNIGAITRQFPAFHSVEGESVFILQLESGNALALNGQATRGYGPEQLMPVMWGAHAEGAIVPYMWGSAMQTHRGQGAILCSSIFDRYAGISNADHTPKGCLPERLKKDGYHTFFASAYAQGGFAHTDQFMRGIGFEEARFADKMQPGDPQHPWGYDDCTFYTRYFDFLDQRKAELMKDHFFGYFEVSSNHDNFNRKWRYAEFEPFPGPSNRLTFAQHYLDSAAMQDHCIATFLKRIEPYREHAHVIIVADHSWPVGLKGSTSGEKGASSDNFLIPFLYLPPLAKAAEYQHGAVISSPILGQVDIYPTILELLSGKHYENSFAPLLKASKDGKPPELPKDYDDCQVMTQPYDGTQVAVVKGKDKYTFDLSKRELFHSEILQNNIESDMARVRRPKGKNMRLGQFLNKFLCARYRYWETPVPGRSHAVPIETGTWVF